MWVEIKGRVICIFKTGSCQRKKAKLRNTESDGGREVQRTVTCTEAPPSTFVFVHWMKLAKYVPKSRSSFLKVRPCCAGDLLNYRSACRHY